MNTRQAAQLEGFLTRWFWRETLVQIEPITIGQGAPLWPLDESQEPVTMPQTLHHHGWLDGGNWHVFFHVGDCGFGGHDGFHQVLCVKRSGEYLVDPLYVLRGHSPLPPPDLPGDTQPLLETVLDVDAWWRTWPPR